MTKLHVDAYNKKLHYSRTLPSPGSGGGIAQSW